MPCGAVVLCCLIKEAPFCHNICVTRMVQHACTAIGCMAVQLAGVVQAVPGNAA
jgi:exosortase/archaeosortase